jgi:ribosomal protein S12 methylthiotransferase accessory factor
MSNPPLPLDAAESEYRRALGAGRLEEFDLTRLDRTRVPTISVAWHTETGTDHATGFGTSPQQARVSALGELSEGIFPDAAVRRADRIDGTYRELIRSHGTGGVADPLELVLPAGSDYSPDQPLIWSTTIRLRTGEPVLVPIEFLASSPAPLADIDQARQWLVTPITNGLGAGSSRDQAVMHGMLELLQRDGDTVSFRALDQGVVLDTRSLRDPELDGLLDSLARVGIDAVVKVAADEFVPVLYCVGDDRHAASSPPIALSAIGEAADPDPRAAARKAVLEFAASRARRIMAFGALDGLRPHFPDYIDDVIAAGIPTGNEPRALAEMIAWCRLDHAQLREVLEPIFRQVRTVSADDLHTSNTNATGDERLPFLLDRLAGFDVLVMDGADPDDTAIRTAKVVVPRIEVETLSYSRIGERVSRRLLDRGDNLVLREDGEGRRRIRLTDGAEQRLGGAVWLNQPRLDQVLGSLYPLYREPGWHAAPMSV